MKINIFVIFVALVGRAATESTSENAKTLFKNDGNPYMKALEEKPWENVQAYVEVRPGAFMFYWLYYADGTRAGAAHKPLVIWIQGGPGYAASGLGNFIEIGPLNLALQQRHHTWVKGRNVLFIDHPVGTGFSYVTNQSLLVNTDEMIVDDLVKLIQGFFQFRKEFRETPSYIFGQSYGGKLSPRLAYSLHKAIERKSLSMNLKGVGLGGAFVDPKEFMLITPAYLYSAGHIDQPMYSELELMAKKTGYYVDKEDYSTASDLLFNMTGLISSERKGLNRLNINQVDNLVVLFSLAELMIDSYVKPSLKMVNQSLHWFVSSDDVYDLLILELFVPSTKFVEMLLNETRLNIAVYNGNLDSLCPVSGASNWVHKLKWPGADEFRTAKTLPINGHKNGLYKKARQLSLWSVFGAGHWVPEDNPEAMEHIMEYVISNTS